MENISSIEPIKVGDTVGFHNSNYSQFCEVSKIIDAEPRIYSFKGLNYSALRSDFKRVSFNDGDYLFIRRHGDDWFVIFKSISELTFNTYVAIVGDADFFDINGLFGDYTMFKEIRHMTSSEKKFTNDFLLKQGYVWDANNKLVMVAPIEKKKASKKRFFGKFNFFS